MTMPIWLYWEGPMPAYISLCHKTVQAHNEADGKKDQGSSELLLHQHPIIDQQNAIRNRNNHRIMSSNKQADAVSIAIVEYLE